MIAAATGVASTISVQTSLAAVFAPAASPSAAFEHMPSTFAFTLEESPGALCTILLQIAAYSATAAAPPGTLVDVEVEVVGVGLLGTDAAVLGTVTVGVGLGALLELLVFELLLPHPARSAAHASATAGNDDRIPGIRTPSIEHAPAEAVKPPASAGRGRLPAYPAPGRRPGAPAQTSR